MTYSSNAGPEWPFPEVLLNGRPVPARGRCGSGMEPYAINPGMSAELRISPYELRKVPKKNDLATVGFYLRERDDDLGEAVFSEPFVLPKAFRHAVDQWNKKQEKQQNLND